MSKLVIIEPFVDPALKELLEKSKDNIASLLIALRRIRTSWLKYFDDFLIVLNKIEKQDPDMHIYSKFWNYLSNQLGREPLQHLYDFLSRKGYGEQELAALLSQKTFDEGAFVNRLFHKNPLYIWMCIFYLQEPRLTQKFFWNQLEYLDKDEVTLVSNYRKLSFRLQDKVSENVQKLTTAENLSLKKRNTVDE